MFKVTTYIAMIGFFIPWGEYAVIQGTPFSLIKLVIFVLILLVIAICSIKQKCLRRTPLDLPMLMLAMSTLPSFFLSENTVEVIVISLSFCGYAIFNFIVSNFISKTAQIRRFLISLIFSMGVVLIFVWSPFFMGYSLLPPIETGVYGMNGTEINPNAFGAHFTVLIP